MTKKNNKTILFVDPFFSSSERNTAGIAYLRGFLQERNIESSAINLNKLIDKKLSFDFREQIIKVVNNNSKYKFNFQQQNNDVYQSLHSLIYSQGPEKIWEAVDKIDVFDKLFQRIADDYPKLKFLCLSVTFSSQLLSALLIATYMRKAFGEKIKIVLGGNVVTGFHEETQQLLKINKVIDYFVTGDGETAIYLLVAGTSLPKITNLSYLQKGKYIKSERQNYTENISKLSSPIYNSNDIIFLQASRRCYWSRCSFCIYKKYSSSSNFYVKKPQKVVNELLAINKKFKNNSNECHFSDSCLNPSFLKEFSKKVISEKRINNSFKSYLRCDSKVDYRTLKLAHDAGFFLFMLGPETLNPRLLKVLKKGHKREDVLRIINDCKKLGIYLTLNFIAYIPTQTKNELDQDLLDINKLLIKYDNIIGVFISKFQLRPESEIYKSPKKYGVNFNHSSKDFLSHMVKYKQIHKHAMTHEEFYTKIYNFYEKNFKKYKKVFLYIPKNN
ncbi:MAG: B12-binding domain-containing radical SAM protein [Promethearchaeota archaeon]